MRRSAMYGSVGASELIQWIIPTKVVPIYTRQLGHF